MIKTTLAAALVAASLMPLGAAHAAADAVPECGNSDLVASFHVTGAGMSHTYGRMVLTNTSAHTCSVHGYGGISFVGKGDGTQIGAAADRTPATVHTIVLDSGQKAASAVAITSTGPYSKKKCRPTKVDGFRVYIPNATASQYVAYAATGCRNHKVHLLAHKPYRAVK